MGKLFTLLLVVSVAIVAVFVGKRLGTPDEELKVPEREWFGSGEEREDNTKIEPFTIAVPEETLKVGGGKLKDVKIMRNL